MADSHHIENRKTEISLDDAERLSKCIGRPPSWIFKFKFLMGGALETRSASSCKILCR